VDIDPSFTQNTITDEIIIETQTQQHETTQNKNSETGAGHSGPHQVLKDVVVGQIISDNTGRPQENAKVPIKKYNHSLTMTLENYPHYLKMQNSLVMRSNIKFVLSSKI
jgi:hypothetical protein